MDPGTIVGPNRRFEICRKIGEGGFGIVYIAKDLDNGSKLVALKVTKASSLNKGRPVIKPVSVSTSKVSKIVASPPPGTVIDDSLFEEYTVLTRLADCQGFPRVYDLGLHGNVTYVAMDLLGESLAKHVNKFHSFYTYKTLLILVDQLLARLRDIHAQGYVHADIKPDNIVVGKDMKTVYLVDFGLASKYVDKSGVHLPLAKSPMRRGTWRYMSVSTLQKNIPSRRDDLESLCYVLAHIQRPSYPRWLDKPKTEILEMLKKKETVKPAELFCCSPTVFADFYAAVRKLNFDEKPDYDGYISMFREAGRSYLVSYDIGLLIPVPKIPYPSQNSQEKRVKKA